MVLMKRSIVNWPDLAVAKGKQHKPSVWDPVLEVLVERGDLHEQSYLDHLKVNGLPILRQQGRGPCSHFVSSGSSSPPRIIPR